MRKKFLFFALFHRLVYMIPLIVLLIVLIWFSVNSFIYWIGILGFMYLLVFSIRDAFFKEKEIQDIGFSI